MNEHRVFRLPGRAAQASAFADEITFVGTATTLIRVAGFSILTGPDFLHRGAAPRSPGCCLRGSTT